MMRRLILALVGLWLVSIVSLCVYDVMADADDYDYYAQLRVINTGATDYTGRVVFSAPADALVDGHFIQADGDDVELNTGYLMLCNMTAQSGTWAAGYLSAPVGIRDYEFYCGNASATRNQIWIGDKDDTCYASDAASLDSALNISLSADIYLTGTPASEVPIISKHGNYELVVSATPAAVLRVWQTAAAGASLTSRPNAAGTYSEWNPFVAPPNYTQVDEAVADDNTTYVTCNGAGAHAGYHWDSYNIQDPSAIGLDRGDDINSITVTYRAKGLTASGTMHAFVLLSGSMTSGTPTTINTAYGNHSDTLARPGGGSWRYDDIGNLQVGIAGDPGADSLLCTQVYATLNVDTIDGGHTVSIPLTVGQWHTISGTNSAALLALTDGTQTGTAAGVNPLHTNAEIVDVGEFDGYLDNVSIIASGTTTMRLQFEPDQISGTTISDQTANGNDVTYSLDVPSDITVTLGSLLPRVQTTANVATGTASIVQVITSMPGTPTNAYTEDDLSDKFGIFGSQIAYVANQSGLSAALVWLIIGTIVCVLVGLGMIKGLRHAVALALAQGIILVILWNQGIMTGWIALSYPFAATGVIMARRAT